MAPSSALWPCCKLNGHHLSPGMFAVSAVRCYPHTAAMHDLRYTYELTGRPCRWAVLSPKLAFLVLQTQSHCLGH